MVSINVSRVKASACCSLTFFFVKSSSVWEYFNLLRRVPTLLRSSSIRDLIPSLEERRPWVPSDFRCDRSFMRQWIVRRCGYDISFCFCLAIIVTRMAVWPFLFSWKQLVEQFIFFIRLQKLWLTGFSIECQIVVILGSSAGWWRFRLLCSGCGLGGNSVIKILLLLQMWLGFFDRISDHFLCGQFAIWGSLRR